MPTRRPLYALYVADAISLVGNAVALLAVPWFVLVTTGSAALTGLAVFFNFLPAVLAAFFGGVIVDRLGFRTTSVAADLASAGAVAAIPLIHTTVGIELWQLMGLVFLGALLDAPGATARQALFPDVVELAGVRMERASGIRQHSARVTARRGPARRSARREPRGDDGTLAQRRELRRLGRDRAGAIRAAARAGRRVRRRATGRFLDGARGGHAVHLGSSPDPRDRADGPGDELPRRTGSGHLPGARTGGVRRRGGSRADVRRRRRSGARGRAHLQRNRPPAPKAATFVGCFS